MIQIAATNEEIDVMNGMKSTSTVDKIISFLFSSIIEGLSWIGLIPLCWYRNISLFHSYLIVSETHLNDDDGFQR